MLSRKLWVVLLVLLMFPAVTIAGDCFVQRQRFSSSHVQRFSSVYYPQYAEVYYFVGQPLRIKALVELEQAEEYAEFLRYKASLSAKQNQMAQTDCNTSSQPEPEPQTAATSLVAETCSKCHSGSAPKAQLTINTEAFLNLDNFKKARTAVLSGEMPKGRKLSEAEKYQVVAELSTLLGE